MIAGAEKLTEAIRKQWIDKLNSGSHLLNGYGATKTAPVISVNTPMSSLIGTVGRIVPDMKYRLIPVPGVKQCGQLIAKGPNVMVCYLKSDKPCVLQPTEFEGELGWYDTVDIVDFDEAVFVRIKNRVKRFANIAGEMVGLTVVEELAQRMPEAFCHTTANRPDSEKGEAIVLFATDKTLTREKLLAKAQETGVAELTVPRIIKQLDSIPVLGIGKANYATLTQLAVV